MSKKQEVMIANEEEETITLSVTMPEADFACLVEKAAKGEMTPEELLSSFVADLTYGEGTNGSDERDYATGWYGRCGFDKFNNFSLIHFMAEQFQDFQDCRIRYDLIQNAREDIENYSKILEAIEKGLPVDEDWKTDMYIHKKPGYHSDQDYLDALKVEIKEAKEEIEFQEENLEELKTEYLEWTMKDNPDWEEELKAFREWYDTYLGWWYERYENKR